MRFLILTCLLLLVFQTSFGQKADEKSKQIPSLEAVPLSVNSNYPEYAPIVSWDGNLLYFAKDNAPGNLGLSNHADIWYTRRTGNFSWSPPINVGRPLNDDGHNIPIALTPLQNQLFLAKKQMDQHFDYLTSSVAGRMWQAPRSLNISWLQDGSFPTSQIKSFHISYDQRYFLFLAETPHGCGQLDIYVSIKKDDGQWAYPFNIGPSVNSDENEGSVFLAADNQSLYFASNGHGGMGGYDIFVSRRLDDSWLQWSEPLNLGETVNSPADEQFPAMSLIGDELYFSRGGPDGDQNIFFCILAPAFRPLVRHIIQGKVSQRTAADLAPLQVKAIHDASPVVLQSSKGNYLTVLPPSQSYLLYQPSPPGTYSESLAFFEQTFFDTNAPEYWNSLLQNEDYQERETHIQQLKNTRSQLLQDLQQKEAVYQQYLQSLNQRVLESLGKLRWSEEDQQRLQILQSKYQQFSQQESTPDTSSTYQLAQEESASYQVVDKNDHFKKQKERLRQQINSPEKNTPKSSEPTGLRAKGMNLLSFEQLLNDLYSSWLKKAALSTWRTLEEQLLAARLQGLSNQLGQQEINRLSKYGLSSDPINSADQYLTVFPTSQTTLPYPWQRDFQEELNALLYTPFLDQLPRLLQPYVEKVLDEQILLNTQKHKAFLLYQDLQAAVNMQIAIEKRLISATIPTPSTSQKSTSSISGSWIQQHNFEVFSLRPGISISFPGIVFEPNTARISPLSEPEINRLIRFLKEHPDIIVEIGLYSYGDLSHWLALDLSSKRADVLANFIADKGISPDRLIKKGYGKKEIVPYKYSWRNNIVVVKLME